MKSTLRGGGVMRCYQTWGEWGVSECGGRPIFIFPLKKIGWIYTTIRDHDEANINIILTRSLPFDSDIRQ